MGSVNEIDRGTCFVETTMIIYRGTCSIFQLDSWSNQLIFASILADFLRVFLGFIRYFLILSFSCMNLKDILKYISIIITRILLF